MSFWRKLFAPTAPTPQPAEKDHLLKVFGDRWGNKAERFAAAQRLTDLADPEVASVFVNVWEIEKLMGNGIAEVCRDALAGMGEIAVDPLAAWVEKSAEIQPARLLAVIGTPRCRMALEAGLNSSRSRLATMTKGVDVYYDDIASRCAEYERLLSQAGSAKLAVEAAVQAKQDAAIRAERLKWDEWR